MSALDEDSANLLMLLLPSILGGRWFISGRGRKRGVEETRPTTDGASGFVLPTGLATRAAHRMACRSAVRSGPKTN